MKRLRTVIRWGVSWEMVPQTVADSLSAVKPLAPGETDAPEGTPRRAVPDTDLAAVRAVLTEGYRDLFDLMLQTGARPGELLSLTTGGIDRTGDLWRAEIANHKTRHHGKTRTLFFNVTAQSLLLPYLKADPAAPLFSVSRVTFGKAVKRACIKAGVPAFTPHWLRHTVATKLADSVGVTAAQRLLGHTSKAVTEIYIRAAEREAQDAAKRLG